MIRYDSFVVFKCTSAPDAVMDPWASQHEVNTPVVASPEGVFQLLVSIKLAHI